MAADTVRTKVVSNTPKRLVINFTNLSQDGAGESAVTKVDKSTYTGLNGLEPSSFVVEDIKADVAGMSVRIYCDRTSPITIAQLGGMGQSANPEFGKYGGMQTSGAGGTGDILFTTSGHSAGDSYDITLFLRKKD